MPNPQEREQQNRPAAVAQRQRRKGKRRRCLFCPAFSARHPRLTPAAHVKSWTIYPVGLGGGGGGQALRLGGGQSTQHQRSECGGMYHKQPSPRKDAWRRSIVPLQIMLPIASHCYRLSLRSEWHMAPRRSDARAGGECRSGSESEDEEDEAAGDDEEGIASRCCAPRPPSPPPPPPPHTHTHYCPCPTPCTEGFHAAAMHSAQWQSENHDMI